MREAAREVQDLVTRMGEDKGLEEAARRGLTQRISFAELYEIVATEKGIPEAQWRAGLAKEEQEQG